MNQFGVWIEVDSVLIQQVIADDPNATKRFPYRRQVFSAEFKRETAFGERQFSGNFLASGRIRQIEIQVAHWRAGIEQKINLLYSPSQ